MSGRGPGQEGATRRGFLARVGGIAAAVGAAVGVDGPAPALAKADASAAPEAPRAEPFRGKHQGGIVTAPQGHTYFAALDLTAEKRDEVERLLRAWTMAAERLTSGKPIDPIETTELAYAYDTSTTTVTTSSDEPAPTTLLLPDTGETQGLSPERLTIIFGFGAGLFHKDGVDRYGLAARRPAALIELPHFAGDELAADHTGGDLSVQACADDPQVAFHAVRQLIRVAGEAAQVRWAQTGFLPGCPDWMRGGSYLVARRIRIALEHWDRSKIAFQEETVGRHKLTGAPIGKATEHDALDLEAADKDGSYVIAENAHVRLAAAATNDGAQILRRPYSYNDGVNFTAERWPPWRQGMEYDAGLFFLCYQRDPRSGFVRIFEYMAKLDMLNQFVTHVGGGLFACPRGVAPGEFIGQDLFAV